MRKRCSTYANSLWRHCAREGGLSKLCVDAIKSFAQSFAHNLNYDIVAATGNPYPYPPLPISTVTPCLLIWLVTSWIFQRLSPAAASCPAWYSALLKFDSQWQVAAEGAAKFLATSFSVAWIPAHTHTRTHGHDLNTHACIDTYIMFAATVAATAASCCKLFRLEAGRHKQVKCKLSSDHNMLSLRNYDHLLIVQQCKE